MEALLPILIQAAAPAIGSLLSGLAAWALLSLKTYVQTKTKNELVNQAVGQVCTITEAIVNDIEQTLVPIYKKKSGLGGLTKEQTEAIKNIAVGRIKGQLPVATAQLAATAVNNLDEFIRSKIEQTVLEMK